MKTAIVVLSAGASSRMNKIKQLLPYKATTLLDNALKTASESGAAVTICVLGANAELIQECKIPEEVIVTININWAEGLGTSISHSVNFLEQHFPDIEAILFTLADQPLVSSDFLNRILDLASSDKIVATKYEDSLGVPALFPKAYFADLENLKGNQGAKQLLNLNRVIAIIPDFVNVDIDTEEDYSRLKAMGHI